MEKLVTCKFSTVPNTFWNIEHSSELNSEQLVFCFHPAFQGNSLSLSHSALASRLEMSKIISQSLTSHPAQIPTINCLLDISIMFHCLFKLNICTMELYFLSSPLLCSDRLSLYNPLFSLFLSVSLTHLPLSLSPPLLSLSHTDMIKIDHMNNDPNCSYPFILSLPVSCIYVWDTSSVCFYGSPVLLFSIILKLNVQV